MIKIENLNIDQRLHNIHCHIPQGKLVGIMGANGAGKSTLLKAIAGILPLSDKHNSGEIYLNGQSLRTMSAQPKSQQLAYLAQNPQIYWDLSVYDVIALGLLHSLPAEKERSEILKIAVLCSSCTKI